MGKDKGIAKPALYLPITNATHKIMLPDTAKLILVNYLQEVVTCSSL